jgi:hypothetical protein
MVAGADAARRARRTGRLHRGRDRGGVDKKSGRNRDDTEAHEIFLLWRYRIVPYRSYVKGWKVSPSHCVNQDLATIWLDK